MSQIPAELRYTKEHEWIRIEGNKAYVGITDFAQSELGDIVFVELPESGSILTAGETFGTVESVKTVSDLYAPLSGKVIEVNMDLTDYPEKVNSDPFSAGWMVLIEIQDSKEIEALLDHKGYASHLGE